MHWYFQVRVGTAERASSRVLQVLETQRTLPLKFHAQQCHEAMHVQFLVRTAEQHASRIGHLLWRLPLVTSVHWIAVEDQEDEHQLWHQSALASFSPVDNAIDLDPASEWWQASPSTLLLADNAGIRLPQHDTEVRMRWTTSSLYVLFDCAYHHLHVRSGEPTLRAATPQLWENDVAELFLSADLMCPTRYMEFEVSPRGEWIDLDITADNGIIGRSEPLRSGFQRAACVHSNRRRWSAFLRVPLPSYRQDSLRRLRLNLFRSQGPGPVELAWQPTHSESFHVPSRFGYLRLLPA